MGQSRYESLSLGSTQPRFLEDILSYMILSFLLSADEMWTNTVIKTNIICLQSDIKWFFHGTCYSETVLMDGVLWLFFCCLTSLSCFPLLAQCNSLCSIWVEERTKADERMSETTSISFHLWSTTLGYEEIEIHWIDLTLDPALSPAVSQC